ncbi:MAG: sulfoxide reductase catalytic subunit YedY [Dinoroseobacter sp.]|jgi:sulfoxide reductase catalytic subunit YedY
MKTRLTSDDVTPKHLYMNRRQIMTGMGALAAGSIGGPLMARTPDLAPGVDMAGGETPNSWEDITTYNNFYEFGTGKSDPEENAHRLTTSPWSIEIGGLVDKPGTYSFDDIVQGKMVEDRIYRLRCVEAWSMVVPWQGFELRQLLEQVGVQSGAKYVAFETLVRPEEMIGQNRANVPWPYREGLRLDEAMNPLALMATGLYGEAMPNQNGAPIRLVVPWKYGFKSIKSIVKIVLTDTQPENSWNQILPNEYGFYSNVNPEVDHPRWSQASERRIGGGLFARRRDTLMFNGYEDEVAGLYEGMDLAEFY